MARDQGVVPFMDFGTVDVRILDMNDNTPLFTTVSSFLGKLFPINVAGPFEKYCILLNCILITYCLYHFLDFWSI